MLSEHPLPKTLGSAGEPPCEPWVRPGTLREGVSRPPKEEALADRFWAKAKRTSSGCWEWTAGTTTGGYGKFWAAGRAVGAHRFSWELANDRKIPEGKWVLHDCDNPPCVNPNHLFIGTNVDNMADMVAKGRQTRGVEHLSSKLTPADVRAIRASDESQRVLAVRFAVSQMAIWRVLVHRTWKHV